MLTQPYDEAFFHEHQGRARMSAEVVVPMVMELVRPRSVTDLGCGLGTWLSVFREAGVEDVLGVDGEYVRLESLEIPKERFAAHDLRQPFAAGRRSDLTMSLEVAEHLSPEYAAPFVATLTTLAPVVLFSAAVPGQGGTEHVNEQWPSYWAQLFRERSYLPVDCLRRHLWDHPRVEWWYQQNLLLYVEQAHLEQSPALLAEHRFTRGSVMSVVHPLRFQEWVDWGVSQSRLCWERSQGR